MNQRSAFVATSIGFAKLAVATSILIGCTSTPDKDGTAAAGKSTKPEFQPVAPPFSNAAYKGVDDEIRSLAAASSTDADRLEVSFQAMFNRESYLGDTFDFMRRVVEIYIRGQTSLDQFDRKLDQIHRRGREQTPGELFADKSYKDLITQWIVSERIRTRIAYVYYRLLQISDDSSDRAKQARAVEGLKVMPLVLRSSAADDSGLAILEAELARLPNDANNSLRKELTRIVANLKKAGADPGGRAALQNMLHDLETSHEAFMSLPRKGQMTDEGKQAMEAIAGQVEELRFKSGDEAGQYVTANRERIRRRARALVRRTSTDAALEAVSRDVDSFLKETFGQDRQPQSTGAVAPDSGQRGNLVGREYKAGRWSLTYDDGPSARTTTPILANLESRGLKSTFFWLAQLTPKNAAIVQRAKSGGSVLANHSFSHANLPKLGSDGLNKEINESNDVHARAFGDRPKYFRCPYGACGGNGSTIRQMIANQGMIHVFWTVDSLDWQDKNPSSVYERTRKQMDVQKRGIILFHDIHTQSVAATEMLMNDLVRGIQNGSMRHLTIEEAVAELNSPEGMR